MNWLQKYTDVSGELRPVEKNFKTKKKKVFSKNPSKKRCISENSPQHVWLIMFAECPKILLHILLCNILIFPSPDVNNMYS